MPETPETEHKDQKNGIEKYLIPIAFVIMTIIAIAGRFACALERAKNAPTEDTVATVITEEPSEEPSALPETPAAPTVNIQTQELMTTEDFVIRSQIVSEYQLE